MIWTRSRRSWWPVAVNTLSVSQWVWAGDEQMNVCWVSGEQLAEIQLRGFSTSTQSEPTSESLRPCGAPLSLENDTERPSAHIQRPGPPDRPEEHGAESTACKLISDQVWLRLQLTIIVIVINLRVIFRIHQFIVESLKCQDIVKWAHHNFPEPKGDGSKLSKTRRLFIYCHKWQRKAPNLHIQEAGTRRCHVVLDGMMFQSTAGDVTPVRCSVRGQTLLNHLQVLHKNKPDGTRGSSLGLRII